MGNSSSSLALISAVRGLGDPSASVDSLLSNHELWRGFFTSKCTVVDLETVMTSAYLRSLRLYHPERLAALLYKSITQLHAFSHQHGEDAATISNWYEKGGNHKDPRAPTPSPQAVVNALMIVQRCMPIVFEDVDDILAQLPPPAHHASHAPSSGGAVPISPRARNFLELFFGENQMCCAAPTEMTGDGQQTLVDPPAPARVFPPLSMRGEELSTSSVTTPLGTVLVDCLVRLCFVPNFTIAAPSLGVPPSERRTSSGTATATVVPEILWCDGVGGCSSAALPQHHPTSSIVNHLNDAFISSISDHRRLVLLTLITVLSRPLHRFRCIEEDALFLSPLTRGEVHLFPTLVASLVNNLVLYDPRGRLPYTSHFITTSEHVVVLGVQLLNISLDYSGLLLGPVHKQPSPKSVLTTRQVAERASDGGDDERSAAAPPPRRSRLSAASRTQCDDDGTELPALNDPANNNDGDQQDAAVPNAAVVHVDEPTPSAAAEAEKSPPSRNRGETSPRLFPLQTLSDSALALQRQRSSAAAEDEAQHLASERALCRNLGWALLCAITDVEARWVVRGLSSLFGNVVHAKSTVLPQSQRTIFEHDLLLVLVWKLVDRCRPFRSAFGFSTDAVAVASRGADGAGGGVGATAYVVPLCYYLSLARRSSNDPSSSGQGVSLSQVAMFTLLKLSAERDFVLCCNDPFSGHLPFALPEIGSTNGTFNDVIALTCLSLLQHSGHPGSSSSAISALHASCATVLANMAPFMQSVALGTAQKLLWQLEVFGRPSFLLKAPAEHGKWLMLIIEVLCSLMQYQYRGSAHLAYALVRSRDVVYQVLDVLESGDDGGVKQGEGRVVDGSPSESSAADVRLPGSAVSTTPSSAPPRFSLAELCSPDDPNPSATIEHRKTLLFTLRCAVATLERITLPLVQSTHVGSSDIPVYLAQRSTLVGALPVPHGIVIRGFPSSFSVDEWVSKVHWGFMFSHAVPGTLVHSPRSIKLFGFA